MSDPTVFIGVGALKAGTTWVHHFLTDHPDCRPCLIKELRYFNKFEGDDPEMLARRIARVRKMVQGYRDAGVTEGGGYTIDEYEQLVEDWAALFDNDVLDPAAYRELVMRHRADAKLVGEITPAYAELSTQMYGAMHAVAPSTKMFYIMRDPVSRLASQIRMRAAKQGTTDAEREASAAQTATRYLDGDWQIGNKRSDYAATITRLRDAVPAEDLHFTYLEDLPNGGARDLCRFLGIAEMDGAPAKKVNEGAVIAMPADFASRAAEMLRPQYEQVADVMGHMPDAWHTSLEAAA